MKSAPIRENEFISVTLIEVESKNINQEKVFNEVNKYLSNNFIAGKRYKCIGFHELKSSSVEVELMRVGDNLYNNGYIDEDFDSDDNWKAFCDEMKVTLELRRFSVPYWYYCK